MARPACLGRRRSRGSSSRNGVKPGPLVKFGQEFIGLKALVLDNFWQEPTMIRERISMQVFQR